MSIYNKKCILMNIMTYKRGGRQREKDTYAHSMTLQQCFVYWIAPQFISFNLNIYDTTLVLYFVWLSETQLRDFGKFHRHFIFIDTCFSFSVGKIFYFRGCGWSNTISTKKWSATHKRWIDVMDQVFTTSMGKDFLVYRYTEDLSCVVVEEDCPLLEYDVDASWDNIGTMKPIERQWLESETPRARKKKKGSIPKKSRRKLFKTRQGKEEQSLLLRGFFLFLKKYESG